jgi:hypothetical protein
MGLLAQLSRTILIIFNRTCIIMRAILGFFFDVGMRAEFEQDLCNTFFRLSLDTLSAGDMEIRIVA